MDTNFGNKYKKNLNACLESTWFVLEKCELQNWKKIMCNDTALKNWKKKWNELKIQKINSEKNEKLNYINKLIKTTFFGFLFRTLPKKFSSESV